MRKCLLGLICLLPASPWAAESDFLGAWDLSLTQGRVRMEGLLVISNSDKGLIGHVEGGPIRLIVSGDRIEMGIDDRTATGMPFERYFRGQLESGSMSGEFGPERVVSEQDRQLCEQLPLACPAPAGSWTAIRHVAPAGVVVDPDPVDLSGRWVMDVPGIRRWTADLTDEGQAWKDGFDVEMDLPSQRCQPSGLVNSWGFRGNDPEIFQSDTRITMIVGPDVRRIYLDERRPPEYSDWYPLGFSAGRWDGSTLVVETTHLQPSVREWMGDPISENARVIERYSLDEQARLVGVMTVYDPQNYATPPVKRARWRRSDDTDIVFPSPCDPDSFYRQLYDEGRMDDYWERGHRRY